MIRRNVTLIIVLVVGLILGGIIGWAAFPKEKEVEVEVTKRVPMTLPAMAQGIRSGDIDVGSEYGMGVDQRYHKIHATVLGLECFTCHSTDMSVEYQLFSAQDVSERAPAPVDRTACLGCHSNGPVNALYSFDGS